MKKMSIIFFVMVFVLMLLPVSVFAQEEEIPLEPIPIDPKKLNLSGTWKYTTTKPQVSGSCPAGNALSGTAVITHKGNEITLTYTSGAKCRPKGVCSYTGGLDKNSIEVANSVVVDNEGGEVNSAIVLMAFNNEYLKGHGTNHYVHPKGFECRWNMNVTFTRDLEKEGKDKKNKKKK